MYSLTLYVTGSSHRSARAISNLRTLCERKIAGHYEIEVIDVLKSPELAEERKVLATPMVQKSEPPPMRRVIGDLSDAESVLAGLGI